MAFNWRKPKYSEKNTIPESLYPPHISKGLSLCHHHGKSASNQLRYGTVYCEHYISSFVFAFRGI